MFTNKQCSLIDLFWRQGEELHTWGRKRFLKFYRDGLDLDVFSIAFANIAWCATKGNKYPHRMLETCFKQHTSSLINLLKPDIVILSGGEAQKFTKRIQELVPAAEVLPIPHYAMRSSGKEKQKNLSKAKKRIAAWTA